MFCCTIWFQSKLFCYSDWFSSRTETFWDTEFVNKTEIKLICPHDKLRDSYVESYPLQAFSSYNLKSLGNVGEDSWILQREAWESLTSVTMKGFWRSLANRWRHLSLPVEVEWHETGNLGCSGLRKKRVLSVVKVGQVMKRISILWLPAIGVNEMTWQVLSNSLSLRTSVQDIFLGLKGTWDQVSEEVMTNTNLLFCHSKCEIDFLWL